VVKRVIHVLEENKPQVVAIPGWDAPASLIALWWCLHNDTPSILMSDSQKHDEIRVWWKESIKTQIVKLHSSGYVAGSRHLHYLKCLGMPEMSMITGIDVVDNAFFSERSHDSRQNDAVVRKRLGLPEKYFLASSRFVQKKNLFLLLEAYSKYSNMRVKEPWKLVLLGDGPLNMQIISYLNQVGIRVNVILPGFRQYDELPEYYGLAGAFIHASTSEQWGLVVNEAMACGLPVIVSTPCGCSPELVQSGCNGYTFDPYNSDQLADLMAHVASDACNRAEMGQASREIIGRWTLSTFASNLVKAANLAFESHSRGFSYFNRLLLWVLIHRKRS